MKKKGISLVLALMFMSVLFFGVQASQAASPTKGNPLVLRFNTVIKSEGAPGSASQQTFKQELEKLTDGRVKVEFFYGWALANNTEAVIGGLQTNSFQASDWGVGSFAEYSKAFLPLDVPYLIAGEDMGFKVVRGDVGRMMTDRLTKDTGIRALMITCLGFRHVTNSKRPITSPADLKGLKIRTQSNPLHIMGFKAFGASPTPMAFAELFTALQQGVVDGQENPIYNIYAVKLYEVQKYLSLTSHICSLGAFIMSEEYYQSLPEDIRAAIDKAAVDAREAGIQEIVSSEKVWLSEMAPKIQINKLTSEQILAFQKIAKAEWPEMAESIGPDYFNAIQNKIEMIQNNIQ
jgi:tripartite ATP-independent transporter DctP family solute receptor